MKPIDMNSRSIDKIREEMIETVTCSKSDIFRISEQCREEFESITEELANIKEIMHKLIEEGDKLGAEANQARLELSTISKISKIIPRKRFVRLMKKPISCK